MSWHAGWGREWSQGSEYSRLLLLLIQSSQHASTVRKGFLGLGLFHLVSGQRLEVMNEVKLRCDSSIFGMVRLHDGTYLGVTKVLCDQKPVMKFLLDAPQLR